MPDLPSSFRRRSSRPVAPTRCRERHRRRDPSDDAGTRDARRGPVLRRRFLQCLGGVAAAGWLPGPRLDAGEPEGLQRVDRTARALGTDVTIAVLHRDRALADAALQAAFAELARVEELMSVYRPDSQVSRLNRERRLLDPHPYLVEVLQAAAEMSRRTAGAFDITVQPLWQLYCDAQQRGEMPSESAVAHVRQQVDWRRVRLSPGRVQLVGDGTRITLNGIAQGFAADKVTEALRRGGVTQALVDTGEIGGYGTNPSGKPWTIGIQHPRREDAYISLAQLADRCLATSGDYATSFSPDFRHHHLFDPRTGRSPEELASVSVLAGTAMEADALSTAVFVLGPDRGMELLRSTPAAEALLVTKSGTLLSTSGFARG